MAWLAAAALVFVLGLLLAEARQANRRLKSRLAALETDQRPRVTPTPQVGTTDIEELLLLRAELQRSATDGAEPPDRLLQAIDTMLGKRLAARGLRLDSPHWWTRRDAVWAAFVDRQAEPPGQPPWRAAAAPLPPAREIPQAPSVADSPPPQLAAPAAADPAPVSATLSATKFVAPPVATFSIPLEPTAEVSAATAGGPAFDYALGRQEPGALERALATVSGWPRLLAPFLAQNIGWFIGGFCFIAGSMFLVSYTSGFSKSLTIHASLLLYTLFIFWSGYTLRRRRPDLQTASNVLFSVAMLLVPLDVASAARLLEAGLPAVLPTLVAGLAVALTLGAAGFASSLASGLMDRALQRGHAALFLGLAGAQLALPLVTRIAVWPILAVLHLGLLGLLAYGLARYSQDWLRAIFVERRRVTYYSAGTLVYAAVVSFVHLTWGAGESLRLPDGYYGPFLMALAGLLLMLDVRFKEWEQEHAYLSRFSFAIHALAAVALLVAAGHEPPRILTLVLAVGIYATMVARYRTATPMFILIPVLAWLYATVVLEHFPPTWHLLAGTPGLLGLYEAYRWTVERQAWGLARATYWTTTAAGTVLVAWTLASSHPGALAAASAAAAAAMAYLALGQAPPAPRAREPKPRNLRNTAWLYVITALAAIALAALPSGSAGERYLGVAVGLGALAAACVELGLRTRGRHAVERRQTEVWVNSALIALALAVGVAVTLPAGAPYAPGPLLVLAVGGALALRLSIGLGVAMLSYAGIALWTACGALVKLHYFPGAATGTVEMTLALGIWGALCWLGERRGAEIPAAGPRLRVLWTFPIRDPSKRN